MKHFQILVIILLLLSLCCGKRKAQQRDQRVGIMSSTVEWRSRRVPSLITLHEDIYITGVVLAYFLLKH